MVRPKRDRCHSDCTARLAQIASDKCCTGERIWFPVRSFLVLRCKRGRRPIVFVGRVGAGDGLPEGTDYRDPIQQNVECGETIAAS